MMNEVNITRGQPSFFSSTMKMTGSPGSSVIIHVLRLPTPWVMIYPHPGYAEDSTGGLTTAIEYTRRIT